MTESTISPLKNLEIQKRMVDHLNETRDTPAEVTQTLRKDKQNFNTTLSTRIPFFAGNKNKLNERTTGVAISETQDPVDVGKQFLPQNLKSQNGRATLAQDDRLKALTSRDSIKKTQFGVRKKKSDLKSTKFHSVNDYGKPTTHKNSLPSDKEEQSKSISDLARAGDGNADISHIGIVRIDFVSKTIEEKYKI